MEGPEAGHDSPTLRASEPPRDAPTLQIPIRVELKPDEPSPGAQPLGRTAGRYVIEDEIGRGGMAVVYRAFDRDIRRHVAMKVMIGDLEGHADLRARFVEEAQATGQLQHPGIVPIYEIGTDAGGRLFFTMKLVRGRTLARIIEQARTGDPETAREFTRFRLLQVFVEVARAVGYAHDRGLLHRDLKPQNIMIGAHGEVHVMDWGLAKEIAREDARRRRSEPDEASVRVEGGREETQAGALVGTPAYMAPEQAAGEAAIGPLADVYALGATLYQLLTGRPPFEGRSASEIIAKALDLEPVRPRAIDPSVTREVEAICLRALAKDPTRRYASAAALAEDVQASLQGLSVAAYPEGPLGRAARWAKRHRGVTATAGAAVVLGLAGALTALVWIESERQRAERERAIAEDRLQEIRRLADLKRLADYEQTAEALWPAIPEKIADMKAWLEKARALRDRLPVHAVKLAELRAKALPYDDAARTRDRLTHPDAPRLEALRREREKGEAKLAATPGKDEELAAEVDLLGAEITALERGVAERRTFAFKDDEAQWEHDTLAGLVRRLERFTAAGATASATASPGADAGALASVEARLEFAETIRERSIERHAEAWAAVIAAIADEKRSPQYEGLKIAPQLGLVPLGQDPRSQLFEFAHLETGEPPERGPDGRLTLQEETGIVLVLVPGGRFRMGAVRPDRAAPDETNIDPQAESDESPVHDQALPPFFLSKHEMTQGQWLRIAGKNPSMYCPGFSLGGKDVTLLHPVEQVSHDDSAELLRRLGLRLPTEAEWEYAARAGARTAFITGQDARSLEGAANLADRYCKENGGPSDWKYHEWLNDGYTVHAPVGSFRPNAFGFHDMAGNIGEWCADWYDDEVYARYARADTSPPSSGQFRVDRGGTFGNGAEYARAASRLRDDPSARYDSLGLRPARVITE